MLEGPLTGLINFFFLSDEADLRTVCGASREQLDEGSGGGSDAERGLACHVRKEVALVSSNIKI